MKAKICDFYLYSALIWDFDACRINITQCYPQATYLKNACIQALSTFGKSSE